MRLCRTLERSDTRVQTSKNPSVKSDTFLRILFNHEFERIAIFCFDTPDIIFALKHVLKLVLQNIVKERINTQG